MFIIFCCDGSPLTIAYSLEEFHSYFLIGFEPTINHTHYDAFDPDAVLHAEDFFSGKG